MSRLGLKLILSFACIRISFPKGVDSGFIKTLKLIHDQPCGSNGACC